MSRFYGRMKVSSEPAWAKWGSSDAELNGNIRVQPDGARSSAYVNFFAEGSVRDGHGDHAEILIPIAMVHLPDPSFDEVKAALKDPQLNPWPWVEFAEMLMGGQLPFEKGADRAAEVLFFWAYRRDAGLRDKIAEFFPKYGGLVESVFGESNLEIAHQWADTHGVSRADAEELMWALNGAL